MGEGKDRRESCTEEEEGQGKELGRNGTESRDGREGRREGREWGRGWKGNLATTVISESRRLIPILLELTCESVADNYLGILDEVSTSSDVVRLS